jgi:hypothetical protein
MRYTQSSGLAVINATDIIAVYLDAGFTDDLECSTISPNDSF